MQTIANKGMKWIGFLQQMSYKSGTLFPCSELVILEKDFETRVRTMDILKNNLIIAGFTEDETKASTGFLSIQKLK